MKRQAILMFLLLLLVQACFAQVDSLLDYKGGLERLDGIFLREMSKSIEQGRHDEGKKFDGHFLVTFEVTVNGGVGPSVSIVFDNDTSQLPRIRKALAATSGNWVNRSGEEQMVVLPITIHYMFDDRRFEATDSLILHQEIFVTGVKAKAIVLKHMLIRSYPSVQ